MDYVDTTEAPTTLEIHPWDEAEEPEEIEERYHYFSNYDDGIKFDKVGWFSVTPEAIAQHIAKHFYDRLGPNALVIDGMTGVGGNAIQFAKYFPMVFAFDLSKKRLNLAKHNAKVCGVEGAIDFVRADYTCIAKHWRTADAIFLSPPWGGPDYLNKETFDLSTMKPTGQELFEASLCLSKNISLLLPKTTNIKQLQDFAKLAKKKNPTTTVPKANNPYEPPEFINCWICKEDKLPSAYSQNQLKRINDQKCKNCLSLHPNWKESLPGLNQIPVVKKDKVLEKPLVVRKEVQTNCLQIEDTYLNNRLKMMTVYFGDLVNPDAGNDGTEVGEGDEEAWEDGGDGEVVGNKKKKRRKEKSQSS